MLYPDFITIPQATTWSVRWPVLDTEGAPADVSAFGVRCQVRSSVGSATVLHEWSTVIGNAVAGNGFVDLLVDPDESAGWAWRHGWFDVKLDDPGGDVTNLANGTMRVEASVTR